MLTMTSKKRLLAAIRHEPVDRVPVTLYEFHHLGGKWTDSEPSYGPLIDMQRRMGETFVFVPSGSGLLGAPDLQRSTSTTTPSGAVETVTRLETPLGPLHAVSRKDPGVATTWRTKRFVENAEDAKRMLSVDPVFVPPDLEQIMDLRDRLGEDGLLIFSMGDPIGHVAGTWNFEAFAVACYQDIELVKAMLDRAYGYLTHVVDWINNNLSTVCIRLWGPEYSGAPLLNPARFFEPLVSAYDEPLVRRIAAGDNISVFHCHGNLDGILEPIRDIGPDILEPLEVLPSMTADVTVEDVKRRIGGTVCLAGGMQAVDLDAGNPEVVRERARTVIREAGPTGLILLPTSTPIQTPLPPQIIAAYKAMFEAAHESLT